MNNMGFIKNSWIILIYNGHKVNIMKFYFTKQIYDKEALIKAAYRFTDNAYIHLDVNEDNYIVTIEAKGTNNIVNEQEFQNEILAQMVRTKISNQTKTLRELMIARAFSSTVIDNSHYEPLCDECNEEASLDSILVDWFEKYE